MQHVLVPRDRRICPIRAPYSNDLKIDQIHSH